MDGRFDSVLPHKTQITICQSYRELSIFEKRELLNKISHAIQPDDELFYKGLELIERAELKGLFDKVKFFPQLLPTG